MVGGGGSKPGYFEVYNGAGSAIGFIGTQTGASYNATALTSAQNGYTYTITSSGSTNWTLIGAANNNVGTTFTKSGGTGAGSGTATINQDGAWFSQLRVGSTSWANAPFYVDGSGNVLIDNSNDTTKTATFKLNSNGITTIVNNVSTSVSAPGGSTTLPAGLYINDNTNTNSRTVVGSKQIVISNSSNNLVASLMDSSGGLFYLGNSSGYSVAYVDASAGQGRMWVTDSSGSNVKIMCNANVGIQVSGSTIVDLSQNATFNSVKIGSTTRLTSAGEAELNSYCKVGSYYGVVTSGSGSTQKRIVTSGLQQLSSGQLNFSTGLSTTESFVATLAYNGAPTEYLSVWGSTIYSSNPSSSSYVFWQAVGY
jgi:hypothetical protein